jgi:hypothetical protein
MTVKHTPLQLSSAGFPMTISNTLTSSTDFSRFFHDYIKHTHRLDWLQQVFPWLYQTHTSPWLTRVSFSMPLSNTPIASTDFGMFFHDYIKHNYRFDWLQQVFSWIYQTHPSLRLTSAGFSITISNTPIASTDFSRFFHYYIKHTHRFDGLQQVFPWIYQTHPSLRLTSADFSMTISNTPIASTDFTRFFHDYIKHTHRLDWLQQVLPWLYQTHPSSWLTSAGFTMTMSNTHIFNWLQQFFPSLYQTHSPLRLTSAGFFMTISNTPIASIDFSRFFHAYIKYTHRLDWLQQVFPWLCQTHPSPWLTSAGFSMTIKHTHRLDWLQQVFPWLCQPHTSSTDFSRFFHGYIKHTHRFDWLQQVYSWLYQTHSPLRRTSAGFSMAISNTPIASTDFSKLFHDYIRHTHRLDWLQQVFPSPYQTHSPLRLTSAGFFMIISNTPIILTDFCRFFHDYSKHTHRFDWLQQVFPWLYQTHPSIRLTSAGFSMTIWNTPIASTDFSRFFHDYIKHTYRLDWLQQVVPWLYQTYPSSWLISAGFSMTISNTLTASTDFSRFFYDYI